LSENNPKIALVLSATNMQSVLCNKCKRPSILQQDKMLHLEDVEEVIREKDEEIEKIKKKGKNKNQEEKNKLRDWREKGVKVKRKKVICSFKCGYCKHENRKDLGVYQPPNK
jgi:hypothetical protein